MLVKSIGQRGSGAIARLTDYILRDKATIKLPGSQQPIILLHNIPKRDIGRLERILLENEATRIHAPASKGRLYCYHDIISFSAADTPLLDNETLESLTRHYFSLRAEQGIGFAAFHNDKQHRHVHCLIGSTEPYTGKALRLNREAFMQAKIALQEYQQAHFPDLVSVVNHNSKKAKTISDDEYQLAKRTGLPSRKQQLSALVIAAAEQSISRDEFYDKLMQQGILMYERGGTAAGIDDGRRYRWETVGMTQLHWNALDMRTERMQEISDLDAGPARDFQQLGEETMTSSVGEEQFRDEDF